MIHPDQLAFDLAKELEPAVEKFSKSVSIELRDEYNFHRKKCKKDADFSRELGLLAEGYEKFIQKKIGEGEYTTAEFLFPHIRKSFRTLAPDGGTHFDHDGVRSVLMWDRKGEDVKFILEYDEGDRDFNTLKVNAQCGKGKNKKQSLFRFDYLKDKLTEAGRIIAVIKFLEELKSDKFYPRKDEHLPAEKTKSKKTSTTARNKLSWTGNQEMLEQIFFKLAQSSFTIKGPKIIEASKANIEKLIADNFDVSEKLVAVPAKEPSKKLVYRGNLSAFVRLLYYLTLKKGHNSYSLLSESSPTINEFIAANFVVANENEGYPRPISIETLSDLWDRTARTYKKDSSKLLEEERKPKKEKQSLLLILSEILPK